MKVRRYASVLVQDKHRHRAMTCDFLGHAAQSPAFEAGVAMTAHDDQIGMERLCRYEDIRCGCTQESLCFHFDVCQFARFGSHVKVTLRCVKCCVTRIPFNHWRNCQGKRIWY